MALDGIKRKFLTCPGFCTTHTPEPKCLVASRDWNYSNKTLIHVICTAGKRVVLLKIIGVVITPRIQSQRRERETAEVHGFPFTPVTQRTYCPPCVWLSVWHQSSGFALKGWPDWWILREKVRRSCLRPLGLPRQQRPILFCGLDSYDRDSQSVYLRSQSSSDVYKTYKREIVITSREISRCVFVRSPHLVSRSRIIRSYTSPSLNRVAVQELNVKILVE